MLRLSFYRGCVRVESDKARFLEVLRWLCRKYPFEGKPRALPAGEDLRESLAKTLAAINASIVAGARGL